MSLPTGSGVERAIHCIASTILPRVDSHGAAAEAGNWRHAFFAAVNGGLEFDKALLLVPEELRRGIESIDWSMLEGLGHLQSELALAYDVEKETTRIIGEDIGRQYGELGVSEIAMTLDLAGAELDAVLVADLKTGRGHVTPARHNWQLRVGALAMARLQKVDSARVALILAPEGSQPRWDIAPLDAFDLADAAQQLRAMARLVEHEQELARKGTRVPPMKMGEWCRYCPAKLYCPAHTAMVRRFAGQPEEAVKDFKQLLTNATVKEAYFKWRLLKQLLGDVEGSLKAWATETPIDLGEGRRFGKLETSETELDGPIARAALQQLHGVEVADKAFEFETSKAAINRALRGVYEKKKQAGEKVTIKALEEEALEQIRLAGGLKKVPKSKMQEHEVSS